MQYETKRLILREFMASDFEDVHEYSSDYENVRHMMFGPNTEEQTKEFLEIQCVEEMTQSPRMHYNMALQVKETGKVIGGISFHMNWRRDDAMLGVIINRHHTGKGYVTEGMEGILAIAFDQLNMHRIHAVCDVSNIGMQKVFERCGFRNEGCMIQRGKARPEETPTYFDQYGYALLAWEWKKRHEIQ